MEVFDLFQFWTVKCSCFGCFLNVELIGKNFFFFFLWKVPNQTEAEMSKEIKFD